jgi:hypothetical protein
VDDGIIEDPPPQGLSEARRVRVVFWLQIRQGGAPSEMAAFSIMEIDRNQSSLNQNSKITCLLKILVLIGFLMT